MSALYNQTNTAPGTFNFISRQEVIEGLSTLASDLSGLNISSFNLAIPANPSFSTIRMPATGLISGYAPIQTSNVILQSSLGAGVINKIQTGGFANQSNIAMAAADSTGATAPIVASSYAAKLGGINSAATYHQLLPTGLQVVDAAGASPNQWMTWNTLVGANSRIALNNISTINGTPVGAGITSYTTLSGSNINNSAVIATPSMVGLSSLNALPISAYQNSNSQPWVSYSVTNTASYPFSLTSGTQTTVLSFSNVPIPTTQNREVTISVPITIQLNPAPAQATNLIVEAYIGGNLTQGCQVGQIITVGPNSLANQRITLCGVATTTGTQPTLNITVTSDGPVTINAIQGAGTVPRQFFFQTLGF